MKNKLFSLVALLSFGLFPLALFAGAGGPPKPNVILIVADDLGYGDLGCYGQKQIKTPNLDRFAAEGLRITQGYGGSSVCAPSRCTLMTGRHTGRATIRGNVKPEAALSADDFTLAQMFKAGGYTTALIGKWGLGGPGSAGAPSRKGFDFFLGYPTQTAAHDYYPTVLLLNSGMVMLSENAENKRGSYALDVFMNAAGSFVQTNQNRPFFLCLCVTTPHANNEMPTNGMQVPDDAPYSNENWPAVEKNFAAMITRLDSSVGRLMERLKETGLENRTLVIFTSDNGPHAEGGHNPEFFRSHGALRGIKRDLYEGGIRVPLMVRWPGRVKPGAVSDQIVAFWDFMPSFAELIGQPTPDRIDGISVLRALLDNRAVMHPPLYWEFHEGNYLRAVRTSNWKGVSLAPDKPLELYNLDDDVSERENVADGHPLVVREINTFMKQEHVPDAKWPDVMPR